MLGSWLGKTSKINSMMPCLTGPKLTFKSQLKKKYIYIYTFDKYSPCLLQRVSVPREREYLVMLRTVGQWVQVDINTETQNFIYNADLLEPCHECNLLSGSVQKITTGSTDPSSGHIINSQMCNWNTYTWCLTECPHGYLVFGKILL